MKKWYFVCLLLHWMALPLSCSFERDNPFDEGGFNYVPPEIILNEEASSIKNLDTIHFDTVTIVLEGNREESLFKLKVDNGAWAFAWQPAGSYGFGKLNDGAHTLYINSMYQGGELVISDSIAFYVLTKGYKPEFEKTNDTTITLFEGNALNLTAKAEGRSPLHYSWIRGNVILDGKNSDSLKITSFSVNDTASYKCIASNEYGEDTSRIFLLRYRPFSGCIKGIVTDSSGNNLQNAMVALSPLNNKDTTDSAGSFVFTSLPGNSYTLKISLPEYYDSTLTNITLSDTETAILPTIKLKMIDTTTYGVVYNSNGNDSGTVPSDTTKYTPGSKITVAGSCNFSKTGYSFSNWNTKNDGTGNSVSPGDSFTVNGNVIFYAQWVVKQFTLSYNGNGNTSGDAPETKKYDFHATVTVSDNGTLKRDGYTFAGWNTAQNGSSNAFATADTFTMPTAEMVLYAQWTALPTYSVTYNKNSADSGTVPEDSNAYYKGKEVTVAGNPGRLSKSSASFSGWNTKADGTGESYNAGAKFPMPDYAVTLYVKWTTNPTYSITYHSAISTGGNVPAAVTADSGTVVTISDSGSLYKTGYSFVGWNTKEDGSGKAYKMGDKVSLGVVNIDLYAQWTKAQFTITYHGNGNTGGVIPQKASILYQSEITIASPGDLAKTGYSFVGWNADTAETGFDYQPGIKIVVTKNINLYARWIKKKFMVTFSGNGDRTSNVPDITEYAYGSKIDSTSVVPSRFGYTFRGWFRDSLTNNKWYYTSDSITSVATLYAKWIIIDFDGNIYTEVKIGNQVWMVENLKTTRYRDGIVIPMVADSAAWASLSNHGYCWYNNNYSAKLKNLYGALYNWYVADPGNPHKIAPEGWHIPDTTEWNTLINSLGGWSIAAGKMRTIDDWVISDVKATNESGFSALPGGYRYGDSHFRYFSEMACWWTTTFSDTFYRMCYNIYTTSGGISIDPFMEKGYGLSIRCIRD